MDDQAINLLIATQERLRGASSTVTIRGFLNLLIGIGFAIGALYLLKEAVEIFSPERLRSITTVEISYIIGIRLSLALIITLISYFFLSLYRKSLDDVKFYNNEITNISSRAAALSISIKRDDKESIVAVIEKLMDDDRNNLPSAEDEKNPNVLSEKLASALIAKLPDLKIK